MRTVVILNGPPGCGKDTIADHMVQTGRWDKVSFKHELYRVTDQYYGLEPGTTQAMNEHRANKEVPSECFGHLSARQALIHVSEDLTKPKHGKDFFGKALAKRCVELASEMVVIADGGFEEEIAPLEEVFDRIVIIHLLRKGCSYKNDSRDYVFGNTAHCYPVEIIDGHPDAAITEIILFLVALDAEEKAEREKAA